MTSYILENFCSENDIQYEWNISSLETLIDAIFIIKNNFKLKIKLIIVGKGSDKNKLQKISNKKNLTKDKYYIKSLGDINNIHNLTLLRNKTIVSEIVITEELKQKIKKYSLIELLK